MMGPFGSRRRCVGKGRRETVCDGCICGFRSCNWMGEERLQHSWIGSS